MPISAGGHEIEIRPQPIGQGDYQIPFRHGQFTVGEESF